MDVVYLDFQKAFDKVPHQRLLLKLKAHGIGNDVINWIEKWLTHRRQRVIVDGEISNWKSFLSGVPQGSSVVDPGVSIQSGSMIDPVISLESGTMVNPRVSRHYGSKINPEVSL